AASAALPRPPRRAILPPGAPRHRPRATLPSPSVDPQGVAMSSLSFEFAAPATPGTRSAVLVTGADGALGSAGDALDKAGGGIIRRAATAARFKGKLFGGLDLVAPGGLDLDRLSLVGLGNVDEMKENDWVRL